MERSDQEALRGSHTITYDGLSGVCNGAAADPPTLKITWELLRTKKRGAGVGLPSVPGIGLPCSGDKWSDVPAGQRPKNPLSINAPILQALVKGFQSEGIKIGPAYVEVRGPRLKGEVATYSVRLDRNGCPLPNAACIVEAVNKGAVREGKQEFAPQPEFFERRNQAGFGRCRCGLYGA